MLLYINITTGHLKLPYTLDFSTNFLCTGSEPKSAMTEYD